MIGVIADSADEAIVREFFELFKTPWEFYRREGRYDVVLCAGSGPVDQTAKLVLIYGGRRLQFDDEHNIQTGRQLTQTPVLSYQGDRIPIYGNAITFAEEPASLVTDESSESVAYVNRFGDRSLARIGYDLFAEVRTLLTAGQPAANAELPALELHITLVRDIIAGCGITLAEIPPVPEGYRFIACLTHDVDHPSIRRHKWDHTTLGFLYRAIFGSLRDSIRRRLSVRGLVANWLAVLKLPFIHVGLAKDFWRDFDDRYLTLETGTSSTFFVIPFQGRPGKTSDGRAPSFRAASYGAQDIADSIHKLLRSGCEVGLHGIDAWLDESSGRAELREIRRLTGAVEIGVRMHWLYFSQDSPRTLEKAGATYDSTIGYNDTVGYRAGTTQVYKPIEASQLLELPLHVMDTALFYRAYLGLSPEQAKMVVHRMADNAVRFGGCITINWHDRSVAPERLWDTSYRALIEDLKTRGAWFATAGQAVAWFRKRRSVVFDKDEIEPDTLRAKAMAGSDDGLPSLRLRMHEARESFEGGRYSHQVDVALEESVGTGTAAEISLVSRAKPVGSIDAYREPLSDIAIALQESREKIND
jgi:hypothetical protein